MKVTIKRWHQVFSWHWDVPNDDDLCGICRGFFEATCNGCKFPGDDCPVVFGECKHAFHLHCLQSWLNQDVARGQCPMCRQVFKLQTGAAAVAAGATVTGAGNTNILIHRDDPDATQSSSTPPSGIAAMLPRETVAISALPEYIGEAAMRQLEQEADDDDDL